MALVAAALFGLAIDSGIYRPLLRRGGGTFSVFIASLGVTLLFEALALATAEPLDLPLSQTLFLRVVPGLRA